jgi:hypothetical protein
VVAREFHVLIEYPEGSELISNPNTLETTLSAGGRNPGQFSPWASVPLSMNAANKTR